MEFRSAVQLIKEPKLNAAMKLLMVGSCLLLGTFSQPCIAAAQALPPWEYYALAQRADSLLGRNDHAGALPMLRQLSRGNEWDGDLWLKYGQAAREVGANAEAVSALEKAFALGVSSPNGWKPATAYIIAQTHARLGNKREAYEWVERALQARFVYRGNFIEDSVFSGYWNDPQWRKFSKPMGEDSVGRDEAWRRDVAFLAAEARRLLAGTERPAESAAFRERTATLLRDVPRLSDIEIIVELRRLLTLLHDGHAGVHRLRPERILPVAFYAFADGLYIVDAEQTHRELIGSKVVAIGGVQATEALRRVEQVVPGDNPMSILAAAQVYLRYAMILASVGLANDTLGAQLRLESRRGLRAIVLPSIDQAQRDIWKPLPPTSAAPLWLENTAANYWLRSLPDLSAVYWQFNRIRDDPSNPIESFLTALRDTVRKVGARNLIIDIRHNDGGRSYRLPPLIRAVVAFQEGAPDRRIYVIAGRGTFSAAQNFATAVNTLTSAIFVGEPTGSRPNFSGEGGFIRLPYHRDVRANISSTYHQGTMWEDHRLWIAPHMPVRFTSSDYFAGRDPALDAISRLIHDRQ